MLAPDRLGEPNTDVDRSPAVPAAPAVTAVHWLEALRDRRDPIGPRWPRIVSIVWSRSPVAIDEIVRLEIRTADLPDGTQLTVELLERGRSRSSDALLASLTARVTADRAALAFAPRLWAHRLGPRPRVVARVTHPDVATAHSTALTVRRWPETSLC